MWRPPTNASLTTRQRWIAAVIIALIIAAGIYRWVVFGDVNRLHGGNQSVQTFTTSTSPPR